VLNFSFDDPRLAIVADPFDLMTTIDPLYNQSIFFCLQFCPLRKVVYLSIGRKGPPIDPKAQPPTAAKGAKPGDAVPVEDKSSEENKLYLFDKLELSEDNRRLLQVLLEQHKQWTLDVAKFMALNGDNYFGNDDLDETNPPPAAGHATGNPNYAFDSRVNSMHFKAERALDERLRALVSDMENIFNPLLGSSSKAYTFIRDFITKAKTTNPAVAKWNLVMLLDNTLQSLPFEALPVAEEFFHSSSSRDFSLHMIGHRVNTLLSLSSNNPAVAGGITGASVKYVIDPLNEDNGVKLGGKERKSVSEAFHATLQAIPPAAAAKWTKLRNGNGLLSLEDFLLNIDNTNSKGGVGQGFSNLLVYTLGRFGSILSPKDIATLNLEKVQFFFNLDSNFNDLSYRRQNSYDVLKNISDIEFENNLQMSILLSLAGVNCMVSNMWSIPIISQNRFFLSFWKNFTTPGKKEKVYLTIGTTELDLNPPANPAAGGKTSKPPKAPTIPVDAGASVTGGIKMKKWIQYSRVLYGVPSLSYSD
jgi:hypothetical protein